MKTFLSFCLAIICALSASGQVDLDSLEQVARKNYRTNLDKALATTAQVLQEAQRVGDDEKFAWALNYRAICYIPKGPVDSVFFYLDSCISYCEKKDIPDTRSKAELNLCIAYYKKSDYEKSIQIGLGALENFTTIGDTLGMGHARYNTGLSWQRIDRFDRAKIAYEAAQKLYTLKGSVLDKANCYNARGTVYQAINNPDSAQYFYQRSIDEKLAVGGWAYCGSEYDNLGSLTLVSDTASALEFYQQAIKAHRARANYCGLSNTLSNVARVKSLQLEIDSALFYARQGLAYSDTCGEGFFEMHGLERLSTALETRGEYAEALRFFKLQKAMNDTLLGLEVKTKAEELQVLYETEKKEKKLAAQRAEIAEKKTWITAFAFGILVLALLIVFNISRQKAKKRILAEKAKAELQAERNRISMDLHDHLGAELTILTASLDKKAYTIEDAKLKSEMSEMADQSRSAAVQLRETIWSVDSNALTTSDLLIKIRGFSDRLFGENVEVKLELSCYENLNPNTALNLYRVIQESLNNTKKHSAATQVALKIEEKNQVLCTAITDNGLGFDLTSKPGGYGLQNMKSRMEAIGGEMIIRSSDLGTSIILNVPLRA